MIESIHKYRFGTVVDLSALHLAATVAFLVPYQSDYAASLVVSYLVIMIVVLAGYHRDFSLLPYKQNRFFKFSPLPPQSSGPKSALLWAAHHRQYHRPADQDPDMHSLGLRGVWWAHVGRVIFNGCDEYIPLLIEDFNKFREPRFFDWNHWIPSIFLGVLIFAANSRGAFLCGFFLAAVRLYHATSCINSLTHVCQTRRFATPDDNRNPLLLVFPTFREGWHNNRHRSIALCRHRIHQWHEDFAPHALRLSDSCGDTGDLRGVRVPPHGPGVKS